MRKLAIIGNSRMTSHGRLGKVVPLSLLRIDIALACLIETNILKFKNVTNLNTTLEIALIDHHLIKLNRYLTRLGILL